MHTRTQLQIINVDAFITTSTREVFSMTRTHTRQYVTLPGATMISHYVIENHWTPPIHTHNQRKFEYLLPYHEKHG